MLAVLCEAFRQEVTHVILVPLPSLSVVPTGLANFAVSVVHSIFTAITYLPS